MIFKNVVKTTILPLALVVSAALVTPANASGFYDRELNVRLNVGSAPNPRPQDIRQQYAPDYPLRSRSLNEQGTVRLRVSLNEHGAVSGAIVERTSGFKRLDDAAVIYIEDRWVYEPLYQASDPVPTDVWAEVTFKLD
jgi:TonB family protein